MRSGAYRPICSAQACVSGIRGAVITVHAMITRQTAYTSMTINHQGSICVLVLPADADG